ncbi:MAG: response regulator [Armatimonadetes bacterium]|nr:response regulator [Armatimonadota bacterium]
MRPATAPVRGNAPWRVMVVDDEALVRATIADMAELCGYQVCARAHDGHEAARLVHSVQPDVILMDLMMPVMDGIEALEIINATRPSCALVVTGYTSQALVKRAAEAGAQGFLVKPCRQADLAPAVETAIAQFERSRVGTEGERIDVLFERAWPHVREGGSPAAAMERALAGACAVVGPAAFALLARRGSRLRPLILRGLQAVEDSMRLVPPGGSLGRAIRQQAICRTRLVGAPPELTHVLCAPVAAEPALTGCVCLFAPESHSFSDREARLIGVLARAAAHFARRAQTARPLAWERWVREEGRPARAWMRRRR